MQKISYCLWFDNQAEDAAKFYTGIFSNSQVKDISRYEDAGTEIHGKKPGSVLTVDFEIAGAQFTALNGGPHFHINPSINFFVLCESRQEVDEFWDQLIKEGESMMPRDKYDWSDYYGWLSDRYGVSWQLYLGKMEDVGQKISPLLFFTGDQRGNAESAHDFYLDVFGNSKSDGVMKYPAGSETEGMVMHSQFKLEGQTFMAMDSGVENDFPFNEAISLVVNCKDQKEVDYYWEKLLQNGGTVQQCGWLKDQFGVSWQIVPIELQELLKHPEKEKRERVTKEMLEMKKLEIDKLKKA